MRSFFQFIVIVALVICGWFLYPMVSQFCVDRDWLAPEKPPTAETNTAANETPVVPKPEPQPDPVVEPAAKPDPGVAVTPTPPPEAAGGPVQRYKTLEEITDNWQHVPANAFPKRVAIKAELELSTPSGSKMKMAEGREVVPLTLNPAGLLTVSSGEGSDMKAVMDVNQTDFKDRVTKRYNAGMEKIRAAAAARNQQVAVAPEPGTGDTPKPPPAGESPPTTSDPDKNVALMKESVAGGAVEGLTVEKVKNWRSTGYEEIDGVGYQTGTAVFDKQTYFGEFETEAKALIRNGKVERWVLPGVGE